MAIRKKAIFFTLISLLFIMVVIAFFAPNSEYSSYMGKVPTLKARITKSNIFMHSLYEEIGVRSLRYSSHYAILSLLEYIEKTNDHIDLQADFRSVLLDGTIQGSSLESQNIYTMQNKTLNQMLAAFTGLAHDELNLDAHLTINSVSVYQDESTGHKQFAVALNLTTYLDSGAAIWNTTGIIITTLPVDKFDDPYYLINQENYHNRIQFTNISNWTTITEVFNHIDDFKYAYESQGPSFLMRLENDSTNSSCCGIESLINPVKLGFTQTYSRSYVDYCFYGQPEIESCGKPDYTMHNFSHISSSEQGEQFYGFRLEIYHINKYNLSKDIDS
jgi:hypothetical protein